MRHPWALQNSDSLKMDLKGHAVLVPDLGVVPLSMAHLAQDARRAQVLLEVPGDEGAVHDGQLALGRRGERRVRELQRTEAGGRAEEAQRARRERAGPGRRGAMAADESARRRRQPGAVGQRSVAALAGGHRRVDALQPQQPELEIAHQRLDRDVGGERLDDRRAEAEQLLVGVVLRAPTRQSARRGSRRSRGLRDGRRKAATVRCRRRSATPARGSPSRNRRPRRGSMVRGRPETGSEAAAPPWPRRASCRGRGQEHHDAVRVVQLVGAENQRVGGVQGHGRLGVTARDRPARDLPVWQRYCISTPVWRSELPSSRRRASP